MKAYVTFMLTMKLIVAPNFRGTMQLPEGTVLICADDDTVPRAQYTSFIVKMMLGPTSKEHSQILGKTYQEVANLADTVMKSYAEFGSKLLCIFDQVRLALAYTNE